MNTHFFNEQNKRLDPIDTLCVFCGKRHSENLHDNCYKTMYKEKSRTNLLVYRNVKFSKIEIGASRCHDCKGIHKKVKMKSMSVFLGVTIVGLAVMLFVIFLLFKYIFFFAFLVGLLLLGFFMVMSKKLYNRIEERFIRKYKILTPEQGFLQYPIVRELLNDGFTFEQPMA